MLISPFPHTPKAVIFDWDNTLVDTWPIIHLAMCETFHAFEKTPWTLEETRANVAHSARDAFPTMFGDRWEEAGQIYSDSYHRHNLAALTTLEHAEEVLKLLKKHGVYMALVSNKRGPTLRKEAEYLGWTNYFSALIGSHDAEFDKPHRAPVDMVLEGSGIKAGPDVWFVGDTAVDLECAYNSGCTPILYGPAEEQHLRQTESGWHYRGFDANRHLLNHEEFLILLRSVLHDK